MQLTTDELHDTTINPDDINLFKMYQVLKGNRYDNITRMAQDVEDEIDRESQINRKIWENRAKMIKFTDKKFDQWFDQSHFL